MLAVLPGCVDAGEWDASTSSHHARYDRDAYDDSDDEVSECRIPDVREPARDPLHLNESRDVHGHATKRWEWMLGACRILRYNVTFAVAGTTDRVDAVAVTSHIELRDPKHRTIAEDESTAALSESRTILDWTLKPGSAVEPGEWTLTFSTTGDVHYEADVDLEY